LGVGGPHMVMQLPQWFESVLVFDSQPSMFGGVASQSM
jgi:hypothetical protein